MRAFPDARLPPTPSVFALLRRDRGFGRRVAGMTSVKTNILNYTSFPVL